MTRCRQIDCVAFCSPLLVVRSTLNNHRRLAYYIAGASNICFIKTQKQSLGSAAENKHISETYARAFIDLSITNTLLWHINVDKTMCATLKLFVIVSEKAMMVMQS